MGDGVSKRWLRSLPRLLSRASLQPAVARAINNGEIAHDDFVERLGSVNLTDGGRRKFLRSFEERLKQEITHPVFGYRLSYRRVFEVEARLLARHLLGEIASYEPMTTR